MIARLTALAAALLVAIALVTATAPARADAKCALCAELPKIAHLVRCADCKDAEKPCIHCALEEKQILSAACAKCATDGTCPDCEKATAADCAFCAAKKIAAEHVWCCAGCEKNKNVCKTCVAWREKITKLPCPEEKKG